ncbi:MAG: pantetheine-phosphate adenylyltransferase [Ruminococcus flavefaciens]|nr:pantetheine-phosphate adenylyltransferase [Ruminococcus flavefaciens]
MSSECCKKAIFAGSFNPFTVGHMSVLQRALPLFDHVYVVVGVNLAKETGSEAQKRVMEIEKAVDRMPGVSVMMWDGLTVDLAHQLDAQFLIRGVRTVVDFEYEYTMACANRRIGSVETIFIPALPEHVDVNSSIVRELQHYGHDISQYLP